MEIARRQSFDHFIKYSQFPLSNLNQGAMPYSRSLLESVGVLHGVYGYVLRIGDKDGRCFVAQVGNALWEGLDRVIQSRHASPLREAVKREGDEAFVLQIRHVLYRGRATRQVLQEELDALELWERDREMADKKEGGLWQEAIPIQYVLA